VGRCNSEGGMTARNGEPFRQWMARESETWPGSFKGADAAIETLLPIAAVAFGNKESGT
jgi:hypothetical protein